MPFHLHAFDDGGRGSHAQLLHQTLELVARAFRHDIHRAIRPIANISGQMQNGGAALREPPKIDALHDTAHHNLRAQFCRDRIILHVKIIAQVKEWTICYNPRMSQSYLTLDQARALYADADSAHDFDHILRVTKMAEHLARAEGADVQVARAAALLHDIARHAEDHGGEHLDHAEMSARDAQALLRQNGADENFSARVAEAIRSHRFRGTAQPQSLEAKILFDADKLDSLGAIGVARAYAVAGLTNQKLYSEPKENAVATRRQHNSSHTPVDEYHVKLKHLHARFYTATAQNIAAERHAYMTEFFERLTREVHGEW